MSDLPGLPTRYFKLWQAQRPEVKREEELNLKMIFKDIECGVLTDFFSNEHPQVIALVFSHLEPKQVANILNSLSDNLKDDVLDRMKDLEFVQKQIVQKIAAVLKEELMMIANYHGEQKGGAKFVEKVKNEMSRLL